MSRTQKCEIVEKRCVTHDCGTSGVRVTSKKWMWIDKLKKFGNVSTSVSSEEKDPQCQKFLLGPVV